MTEPRDVKIKRLHMRSIRRGIKEMDLILSDYATKHLPDLSDADLDLYDQLLSESDLEIYSWITGQKAAPEHYAQMMETVVAGAHGLTRPN